MTNDFETLEQSIHYVFKDQALLECALTHRSVKGENNERLEFLGDSIVNFIVADILYERFPNATEGNLSRLRANLVNRETLSELAHEFELSQFMRLGPGELKSGGRQRISIVADAMEAIIAAIYLDSNIEVCKSVVTQWYEKRLSKTTLSHIFKDPKTRLQEYLQAHKYDLPSYKVTLIEGDAHNQVFHVECSVDRFDKKSHGLGTSRRRAEQDAAENFLSFLKV